MAAVGCRLPPAGEDADTAAQVQALSDEVTAQRQARLARISGLLGADATSLERAAEAAQEVRALMFIDRLLEEVDTRLQRHEDEDGA